MKITVVAIIMIAIIVLSFLAGQRYEMRVASADTRTEINGIQADLVFNRIIEGKKDTVISC